MLTPADREIIARDRAIPGLGIVLDPDAAAAAVAPLVPDADLSSASVHYVRYKPGRSCLTGLRLDSPRGELWLSLKALAENADDKWSKALTHRTATVVADHRLVVRQLPDDAELRGPRWLLSGDGRGHARSRLGLPSEGPIAVLAYKPERRLVLSVSDGTAPVAVVKCYEYAGFARAKAALEALRGAPEVAAVHATAWEDQRAAISTPWIEGAMLQIVSHPLDAFDHVGRELAVLHDASIAAAPPNHPATERQDLERLTSEVAWLLPHGASEIHALTSRLAACGVADDGQVVPIHGDFYNKQVLVGARGIAFLDFDESRLGDPHVDLAQFAAHVERDIARGDIAPDRGVAVIAALLQGYRSRRAIDARRFAWRLSEALLRLAPHPFRDRHPQWQELTLRLVARAREVLDGLPDTPRHRPTPLGDSTALRSDAALAFAAQLLDHTIASGALRAHAGATVDATLRISRAEVWRHKPGRRCLLAFDVQREDGSPHETWLGKVRAKGTDVRGAAIHRSLWDAGTRCIPEPLGMVHAFRMTLQHMVPGIPCLEALHAGADPETLGSAIAASLFRLHTTAFTPGRSWTLDDEVATLTERLLALRARLSEQHVSITNVQRMLAELAAPLRQRAARGVLHRDFYHDQALVDDSGTQCTIVDLDLVAAGDPALDVGNFVGHLVELVWRAGVDPDRGLRLARGFAQAYGALAPTLAPDDAIARYACLTLGRLVEIAAHHDDRRAHIPVLLAALQERLARVSVGNVLELSLLTEGTPCAAA